MRVAVTGAAGFVGSDIVRELTGAGHQVLALVRRPGAPDDPRIDERPYALEDPPSPSLLDDVDAVVHCAFARAERSQPDAYRVNVEGTSALFSLARQRDVPFLFFSSLTALPEARSLYGQQKLELERRLAPHGACIVRPGLVVGNGGLVRNLVETMRRRHVLPLVDGGRQPVQCVWLGDLSALARVLVERRCPAQSLTIADEPALIAADLARDVRRALRLRATTVYLPYPLAYALAALVESVGLESPLSTESLRGLRAARLQPVDDAKAFGVALRPWREQLALLAAALGCATGQDRMSENATRPQRRD